MPNPTSSSRDYFRELGVRTFINAAGTYTRLTASLMLPEVLEAMEYAAGQFVHIEDLEKACGARIAALLGCEDCMITAGAGAALSLGTAACMTETDPDKIRRLPDTSGMKSEVIIQKAHRYGYDHAIRNCGIRFVEVETPEELSQAVCDRTAMMLFFNDAEPLGQIKAEAFALLAREHHIPCFNDAAADVPPVEHLSHYIRMGYDLVTFSGGKGLRGPQSSGLLLGRKDLIQAARLNASPHSDTLGRPMKVSKEEILGLMVAVESYLRRDHDAEWREWEKRVQRIGQAVEDLPGVTTEIFVPPIANHSPHLRIRWDQTSGRILYRDAVKALAEGEPSIEVTPGHEDCLVISVWMMKPGEDEIVGHRLCEILTKS